MALAAISVVLVGALLPATPLAATLGFPPLPGAFFAVVAAMVLCYLVLIEFGKRLFYRATSTTTRARPHRDSRAAHLTRRMARFTSLEHAVAARR